LAKFLKFNKFIKNFINIAHLLTREKNVVSSLNQLTTLNKVLEILNELLQETEEKLILVNLIKKDFNITIAFPI